MTALEQLPDLIRHLAKNGEQTTEQLHAAGFCDLYGISQLKDGGKKGAGICKKVSATRKPGAGGNHVYWLTDKNMALAHIPAVEKKIDSRKSSAFLRSAKRIAKIGLKAQRQSR